MQYSQCVASWKGNSKSRATIKFRFVAMMATCTLGILEKNRLDKVIPLISRDQLTSSCMKDLNGTTLNA
jgi:hypothetical protein